MRPRGEKRHESDGWLTRRKRTERDSPSRRLSLLHPDSPSPNTVGTSGGRWAVMAVLGTPLRPATQLSRLGAGGIEQQDGLSAPASKTLRLYFGLWGVHGRPPPHSCWHQKDHTATGQAWRLNSTRTSLCIPWHCLRGHSRSTNRA